MDFITTPLVLLIIFGTLYKIIKLYATRRERLLYLEKMTSPTPPPFSGEVSPLPPYPMMKESTPSRFTALRWATLAIGVGLGILAAIIVIGGINPDVVVNNPWKISNQYGILLGASMLFFGGLGLLVSFIIESRQTKR